MTTKISLALIFFSSLSLAQDFKHEWSISLGGVDTEFDSGTNFVSGYTLNLNELLLTINFVDLNIYSTEPEGYHNETTSNGNEVCRNEENGQFADKGNCSSIEYDHAVSIEGGYRINNLQLPVSIGYGIRVGGESDLGGENTPYVTIYTSSPSKNYFLSGRVGSNYSLFSIGMNYDSTRPEHFSW